MSAPIPKDKAAASDPFAGVVLRRSRQARRMTLRVSSLDGRVTLTLPRGVAEADVMRFLAEKEEWVQHHLSRLPAPRVVEIGTTIEIDGVPRQVVASGDGSASEIAVRPDLPVGPQVQRVVVFSARRTLGASVARHAGLLGCRPGEMRLRDTRSRWGSCSSAGDLMFNWRLMLGPAAVADYVAAHEVAHLIHMDHSRAFWSVVARLCPDHVRHRAWLRREGHRLHAWRFTR